MKRFKRSPKSLNLYSRFFFGLWMLVMVATVGFRQITDNPSYKAQLDAWHQKRINSLKSENGWLNLAGLFWLNEGKNTLGRGSNFDVPFPTTSTSAELGVLELKNGEVRFKPKAGADVSVYAEGITTLDFNQAINPPCAFTAYATCLLPPKQDKLAFAVTAGEKRYGDH